MGSKVENFELYMRTLVFFFYSVYRSNCEIKVILFFVFLGDGKMVEVSVFCGSLRVY